MDIVKFNKREFADYIKNKIYNIYYYESSAGTIKISYTDDGIYEAIFVNTKDGKKKNSQNIDFSKFLFVGSNFEIKIWECLLKIPSGQVSFYQEIANIIGNSKAYRAVANAIAKNNIAYFIPCHRIIRKDGTIGGYKWGVERKVQLLDTEKNPLYEVYCNTNCQL